MMARWVSPLVLLAAFAFTAAFAAPGLYLRDSGELTAAAATLGVAHETGFPLWCLLAKACALVPLGEVAARVNFFSALAGALAAWGVYRLVRALAGGGAAAELSGVGAAALLLSGLTFFKSSTVAEVYAPTAAGLALGLVLYRAAAAGDRRAALALALVGGLSLGLHAQLRLLLGPPVIVWALWRLRRGDRWPLTAPLLVALGAAVVAYLPLRAAQDPPANWADPQMLTGVAAHLAAARIRRAFSDQIAVRDLHMFWVHFRQFSSLTEGQLGVPALLAAFAGLVWLVRKKETRATGLVLGWMVAADAIYSAWVNPMGLADLQDGAPTALALAALAGAAIFAAAGRLGRAGPYAAGALAVLLCVPAALADPEAKRGLAGEEGAFVAAALDGVAPRALVISTSDDLSAGALYEQAVAGARPDVTVLVRQQLWDGAMVVARIRRAGGEVRDPLHGLDERARLKREAEALPRLVERELPLREIAWEPASDAPPVPAPHVELDVPLFRLHERPVALPPARPLAERIQSLLAPARDPLARRLDAALLGALGRGYLARDDDARAAALFQAARDVHPGDAAATTNLAVVHARRGDYPTALALVEEVLARDPDRVTPRENAALYHVMLGRRALDAGDRAGAAQHARAALALKPQEPNALELEKEATK
jgi:hypothetical protein